MSMNENMNMNMNALEKKAARKASVTYTTVSLVVVLVFLAITLFDGNTYTAVARIGGMIWVFVLSMIVSMPIVIPSVKKKIVG
ncbi:hypothetical protein CEB3_c28350 [Peptococcaceae bacterium CEB3]|nr:hypothetical protein CEB3_c28350 [Peptococcaceae bacterium CEB3]